MASLFFGVLLTLRILAGSMYEKGEAENLCVNIHDIGQSLEERNDAKVYRLHWPLRIVLSILFTEHALKGEES